jgi:hypothetical protein
VKDDPDENQHFLIEGVCLKTHRGEHKATNLLQEAFLLTGKMYKAKIYIFVDFV